MRILINALSAKNGGGQTYLINLLEKKKKDSKDMIFILTQPSFDLLNLPLNIKQIKLKIKNPFIQKIWEELFLIYFIKKFSINIYFSPSCTLPFFLSLSNIKTVVTFQNMLPFDRIQRKKYPIFRYRWMRDYILEKLFLRAILKADLVIFLSKFAYNTLSKKFLEFNTSYKVIPHGVDNIFIPKTKVCKNSALPSGNPYFTYVSYIDYYKGHIEMVEGFKLYCANGGKGTLYFIGHENKSYAKKLRQKIKNLCLSRRVKFLGVVEHYKLPCIYQNAFINFFGSYVENCPNILLEIMASGRPALVSNKNPMPEIAKKSVLYYDPSDPVDFCNKLILLNGNKKLQKKLSTEAQIIAKTYSWDKTAKTTWASIKELMI